MRITKAVKDHIVKKAIEKSGIMEQFAELRADRAEWTERVRVDALGGQDKLDEIDKLSVEFRNMLGGVSDRVCRKDIFREDYSIYLNVAGMRDYAYFSGASNDDAIKMKGIDSISKITPSGHTIIGGTTLAIEFDVLLGRQRDLNSKYGSIEGQIRAMIGSFTTTQKLLKAWPEAVELLPPEDNAAKQNLPVLLTSDLNKLLGLPTEANNNE